MYVKQSITIAFGIFILVGSLFEIRPFQPKVSIITSVYNGDVFIEGFMHDITRQTIYDQSEHIIVNAASPGVKEEGVIQEYMKKFPNIVYVKLAADPGIYGVWNLAIRLSRGDYITNANIDDALDPQCYEIHKTYLDNNAHIDLVYSDFYMTHKPHETMENHTAKSRSNFAQFSKKAMKSCLPNNHPMWRKSLHEKHGYFDEAYKGAGDYDFWLRLVESGVLFLKVPGILGLYYYNPKGLSTGSSNAVKEALIVHNKYKHVYN